MDFQKELLEARLLASKSGTDKFDDILNQLEITCSGLDEMKAQIEKKKEENESNKRGD